MKLRTRILQLVVATLCLTVSLEVVAQRGGGGGGGGGGRGGGGRGGGNPGNNTGGNNNGGNNNGGNNNGGNNRGGRGNNPGNGGDPRGGRGNNLPPEGTTREDTLTVTEKARPMLEMVELLQKRTGRPISYEEQVWEYEGVKEKQPNGTTVVKGADINRVAGFQNAATPTVKPTDILSLRKGTFEVHLIVDARTHKLAEPIDGSISAILNAITADYEAKQLPGIFMPAYLGPTEDGGYGWLVTTKKDRKKDGSLVDPPVRVLDYMLTFPTETRPTVATFELIAQQIQKASGRVVEFKHIQSDAMTTGRTTTLEAVKLPAKQTIRIGATNERARDVLAKALKNIERGDPRFEGPIPQRAWRLLWLYDKQKYVLDVVDVKQAQFNVNGTESGVRPVTWPLAQPTEKVASAK